MKIITFFSMMLISSLGFAQATHTIDFEPAGIGSGWSWTASDNAPSFSEITNPVSGGINTSATVVEFIAYTTDQNWALCHTDDNGEFTFDATNSTVKIMVYKSVTSNVAIKLEGTSPDIQLVVPNTLINQWEELTFDFSEKIGSTYNKIVVIPDFVEPYVTGKDRTTDNTIYFDNIQIPEGGVVNEPEPTSVSPIQPARAAADVISLFSDAYTDIAVSEWSTTWDNSDITDVNILGDDMKKVDFGTFLGIQLTNEIDLSDFTHMHFDYWITDALTGNEVLNPKLSNHAGLPDTAGETGAIIYTNATTASGQWATFDFPLADFTNASAGTIDRDKIYQILLDCSATLDLVYFDNIYFYKGTSLGAEDFKIEGLTAYPNPANSEWVISTKDQIINSIEVYNILGKKVISLQPNALSVKVDASSLSTGMYFSTIITESGTVSKKLIKN